MPRGRKKKDNSGETTPRFKGGNVSMAKLLKMIRDTALAEMEAKAQKKALKEEARAKKRADKEDAKAKKQAAREEARALKSAKKNEREHAVLKRAIKKEVIAELFAKALAKKPAT